MTGSEKAVTSPLHDVYAKHDSKLPQASDLPVGHGVVQDSLAASNDDPQKKV